MRWILGFRSTNESGLGTGLWIITKAVAIAAAVIALNMIASVFFFIDSVLNLTGLTGKFNDEICSALYSQYA